MWNNAHVRSIVSDTYSSSIVGVAALVMPGETRYESGGIALSLLLYDVKVRSFVELVNCYRPADDCTIDTSEDISA